MDDAKNVLKKKPWLRGSDFDPSHPWYYVKGYPPLAVAEIEPTNNVPVPGKRGRRVIEAEIDEAQTMLGKSILHYLDLIERGDAAISEYDRMIGNGGPGPCKAIHSALALAHNHIAYASGRLLTLRRMLAGVPRPAMMFQIQIPNPDPESRDEP